MLTFQKTVIFCLVCSMLRGTHVWARAQFAWTTSPTTPEPTRRGVAAVCVTADRGRYSLPHLCTFSQYQERVLATPTKNCFGCWSLVLLFRLNDNRVGSSVTVLVMTSETIIGYSRQNAPAPCSHGSSIVFRRRPISIITMDTKVTVKESNTRKWYYFMSNQRNYHNAFQSTSVLKI
jgi:hypothetical protein